MSESNEGNEREISVADMHGVVAALVQAWLSEDVSGFNALVNGLDGDEALSALSVSIGALTNVAREVYGSDERLATALRLWEPGQRLPDPSDSRLD